MLGATIGEFEPIDPGVYTVEDLGTPFSVELGIGLAAGWTQPGLVSVVDAASEFSPNEFEIDWENELP